MSIIAFGQTNTDCDNDMKLMHVNSNTIFKKHSKH